MLIEIENLHFIGRIRMKLSFHFRHNIWVLRGSCSWSDWSAWWNAMVRFWVRPRVSYVRRRLNFRNILTSHPESIVFIMSPWWLRALIFKNWFLILSFLRLWVRLLLSLLHFLRVHEMFSRSSLIEWLLFLILSFLGLALGSPFGLRSSLVRSSCQILLIHATSRSIGTSRLKYFIQHVFWSGRISIFDTSVLSHFIGWISLVCPRLRPGGLNLLLLK